MKNAIFLLLVFLTFSIFAAAQTATKTITNADLAKYRQQRLKNDPDDDNERRKLGLPSRAEEAQAREQSARETAELAAKIRERESAAQNYWQSQAYELKTEIAAINAEINYVRARVNEIPAPQTFYAVGYNPYYTNCCYGGIGLPNRTVNSNAQIRGNINIGRNPQISVRANTGRSLLLQNPVRRGTNMTFGGIPYQQGILTVPFTLPTAQNLTREDLLNRLRYLEQTRAGLFARYSILEDEARRDGVRID